MSKKLTILICVLAAGGGWVVISKRGTTSIPVIVTNTIIASSPTAAINSEGFELPVDRTTERVTKKKFGTYVTPQNSPIKPEKFTGYHTGIDFETFPNEADSVIEVHAICLGRLDLVEYASGYGGVAVQSCTWRGEPVTVVYGHLKLSSINSNKGDTLKVGEVIGWLGKGYSSETDGERKHLHLGIHKGNEVNIRGYVSSQDQLSGWIDPCEVLTCN